MLKKMVVFVDRLRVMLVSMRFFLKKVFVVVLFMLVLRWFKLKLMLLLCRLRLLIEL